MKPKLLFLGRQFWADKFWGICGIFGQFISTHFGTVSPLDLFSINLLLFLQQTKPIYIYLGLGLEFRIYPSCVRSSCMVTSVNFGVTSL